MTTLLIKDLSVTAELDRNAMTAVRGGMGKSMFPADWNPLGHATQNDFSFNASQMLGQSQNTLVNNGNNAAFVSGITANVHPQQNGSNNINFGH